MKTSERFTNAVTKLYNAFHENRLNTYDCTACAVGNLCDGDEKWNTGSITSQIPDINIPKVYQIKTGYSALELRNIEALFMFGRRCELGLKFLTDGKFSTGTDKETQFKGLCAVVEYLCELEGIPNVMDYTCLFETENEHPKHKLEEAF